MLEKIYSAEDVKVVYFELLCIFYAPITLGADM